MRVYKLTDKDYQTHNETQWGPNITHSAPAIGSLCSPGWIHCYSHPILSLLMDPIHGNFGNDSVLWECEATGKSLDDSGLKMGVESLTTIKIIDKYPLTTEHRIRFAIGCVLSVENDPGFVEWARNWLGGKDKIKEARPVPKSVSKLSLVYALKSALAAYAMSELSLKSSAWYACAACAACAALESKINFTNVAEWAITDLLEITDVEN